MKKQTLSTRVLAFLKGGDEAKVSKFEAKLSKEYAAQIKAKEEAIAKLEERIEDAEEVLNETILNVDVTRINNTDSAESYVAIYMRNVRNKRNVIKEYQNDIADIQTEIDELKADQEAVYGVEA